MIMPILSVHDILATVDFYVDKLGFRRDMVMDGPDGKPFFGMVTLGSATFGIGQDDRVDYAQPLGNGVQLMVYLPEGQDIDTYYEQVRSRGVRIDDPVQDTYWGDRVFTVHDPNGYWIMLATTVRQMTPEEINEAMLGQAPAGGES